MSFFVPDVQPGDGVIAKLETGAQACEGVPSESLAIALKVGDPNDPLESDLVLLLPQCVEVNAEITGRSDMPSDETLGFLKEKGYKRLGDSYAKAAEGVESPVQATPSAAPQGYKPFVESVIG